MRAPKEPGLPGDAVHPGTGPTRRWAFEEPFDEWRSRLDSETAGPRNTQVGFLDPIAGAKESPPGRPCTRGVKPPGLGGLESLIMGESPSGSTPG